VADDLDSARGLLGHKRTILDDPRPVSDPRPPVRRAAAQAANALTLSRLAMAVAWIWLYGAHDPGGGAPAVAIAIAASITDFIDGRIARRMGAASAAGRWLDSAADVVFVLSALGCFAAAGAIPAYIPILIAISFSQYAIDSMLIAPGSGPIRSRLGHWGGVVNYALALALAVTAPGARVRALLRGAIPLVAGFYLAAIVERALGYRARSSIFSARNR
jgi:cardiolipin synthase (CMP-forming)